MREHLKEYTVEAPAPFRGRVRMSFYAYDRDHGQQRVCHKVIEDIEVIDNGSGNEPEIDCSELEVRVVE